MGGNICRVETLPDTGVLPFKNKSSGNHPIYDVYAKHRASCGLHRLITVWEIAVECIYWM